MSNLNSLSCLGISDDEQTITLSTVVPVYLIVFLFYWFFSIRKMRKGLMEMGKQKECNAIHARNVVLVSRNLLTWNNTCWVICLRYFRIIVGHLSFSTEFFFKSTFIVVFFLLHGKTPLLMSCFIILHQEKNFQYLVSGILFILFVSIKDQ